jgi:CRP/FNR family transcriptional regulator, anaerobic regulatory protein
MVSLTVHKRRLMTELEQYLHSTFTFDSEDLIKVSQLFRPVTLNKGDFFLTAGRQCNRLCFIKSGLLRIYADLDGREVTQWISSKGYFVAELSSLLFQTPSRWNMQALTNMDLFVIDRADYNRIGEIIPKWPETEKLFLAHCFTIMEDRIFAFLSMTAEERYHFFFEKNREMLNQVPLQYIASMLGMTPETISRIRRKQLSQV